METRDHDQADPPGYPGPAQRPQSGVARASRGLQSVQEGSPCIREACATGCEGKSADVSAASDLQSMNDEGARFLFTI